MASASAKLLLTSGFTASRHKSAEKPPSPDGGLSVSGGSKLLCAQCDACQEVCPGDGTAHYICVYTGVTVPVIAVPPDADDYQVKALRHQTDDRRCFCPRTMTVLMGTPKGRGLVRGVLRGVEERGELDNLLASYPACWQCRLSALLYDGRVS